MFFWVGSSFFTARLRKLFDGTGEGLKGDCDKGCFAGEGGFDGLRDVVCDLVVGLWRDLEENFLKRSLSVIRGSIFGGDTLKDAEVRDLRGA